MVGNTTAKPGRWKRFQTFVRTHAVLVLGVWALIQGAGVLLVMVRPLDGCNLHLVLQLAGAAERVVEGRAAACSGITSEVAQDSLRWDFAFAALYAIALHAFLRVTWGSWRISRLENLRPVVLRLPLWAAGFDWVENALTLRALDWAEGPVLRSDTYALLIASAAWAKILLLAVSVVALVMACWVTRAPKSVPPPALESPTPQLSSVAPPPAVAPPPELGICCSGGGIRSAGYTVGALRRLDEAQILAKARWLSAVSGGAYVAGAIFDGPSSERITPAQLEAHLLDEGGRPHRYLHNDPGGLALALVWLVGLVLVHLLLIALAVVAAAWPVGWLVKKWAWGFESLECSAPWEVPFRLWAPGLLFVALAGAVFVATAALPKSADKVAKAAKPFALLGGGLLGCLVIVPILVRTPVRALMEVDFGEAEGFTVAGVSLATIGGVVWSVVKKPLARAAPRLGGVLLSLIVVAFGAHVARDAGSDGGLFASPWLWAMVSAALVIWYCAIPMGWASARLMYRAKLRRSFSLDSNGTRLIPATEHRRWDAPPCGGPELLVCATAHRVGLTGNGIPAETFTISRTAVRIGDVTLPTSDYLAALPKHLQQEKTISSWQATTGAAVSSAMGRFRFGTTNALLAALNLDLGGWVPNPRRIAAGWTGFKRIRLGYLVKEILGLYDEKDDYVFVADGGQWENLGLVELLRRQCATIICIDASGDDPYTFNALRQAVALARTELPEVDGVDLRFLGELGAPADGGIAPTTVGETTIHYSNGVKGRLIYAKAQVAADLSLELRRFAARDAMFPRYSTARQSLGHEQFCNLARLGRESGDRVVALYQSGASAAEYAATPPPGHRTQDNGAALG